MTLEPEFTQRCVPSASVSRALFPFGTMILLNPSSDGWLIEIVFTLTVPLSDQMMSASCSSISIPFIPGMTSSVLLPTPSLASAHFASSASGSPSSSAFIREPTTTAQMQAAAAVDAMIVILIRLRSNDLRPASARSSTSSQSRFTSFSLTLRSLSLAYPTSLRATLRISDFPFSIRRCFMN